jgi:hypothetical protein
MAMIIWTNCFQNSFFMNHGTGTCITVTVWL